MITVIVKNVEAGMKRRRDLLAIAFVGAAIGAFLIAPPTAGAYGNQAVWQVGVSLNCNVPHSAICDQFGGTGGFWGWYDRLSETGQVQVVGPVMNKLRAVLTRRFAADLLGSAQSTFSLARILDGGILLARLPKGVLGDDTTRLVGSLLLAGLWQAAAARASSPEPERLDAAVYADECQNFLHLPGSLDDVLVSRVISSLTSRGEVS